jgi:sortase B
MTAEVIGRKAIKATGSITNYIVLIVIAALIAFAGYALWDSNQLHRAADKSNYSVYKPTAENQGKSFKELQALNAEVFAWLCVYGTNIDYPVTQGNSNMKYVNTSAEGLYSLSGAIFLDSSNSNDFSDFNSIIYGHHMARKVMFGEIGAFSNRDMFDSHRYGSLYFNGKDHGLEFFAFIHTDSYDSSIYSPNVGAEHRQAYLNNLLAKAMYTRDISVTVEDHIVLLSTCSSNSTNGRDILVGRITDSVYDPTINTTTSEDMMQTGPDNRYSPVKEIPILLFLPVLLLAIRLIVFNLVTFNRSKQGKRLRTEAATNG